MRRGGAGFFGDFPEYKFSRGPTMNTFKTALAAGVFAVVGSVANAASFGFTDAASGTYATLEVNNVGGLTYEVTLTNNSTGTSVLTGFLLSTIPSTADITQVNNDTFVGDIAGDTDFAEANNLNQGGYPDAGTYEFCLISGGSNSCPGAGSGLIGVQPGTSAVLRLTFNMLVDFDGAGARFQAVPIAGSLKLSDNCDPVTDVCGPPVTDIPLPASLPLLLAGLGVTGYVARRKQKAA